jgi:uncharacterized glyoxalase superfamily protein PhnB
MAARLSATVPVLQVRDARRTLEFYVTKLGFTKEWEHQFEPGFPLFVSIGREGVRLFLTEHPESALGSLVYIHVDHVDALTREFQAAGADIAEGPIDQPWGMRELQLTDPDGNKLRFGQKIGEEPGRAS